MPNYAGTAHTGEKLKKQDEGDNEMPEEEEELIEFPSATAGPQFTCFTITKVHLLTQLLQARSRRALAAEAALGKAKQCTRCVCTVKQWQRCRYLHIAPHHSRTCRRAVRARGLRLRA
jgi:hypothetical protein